MALVPADTLRLLNKLYKVHQAEVLPIDVVQDARGHPELVCLWVQEETTVWIYHCIINPRCNHFVIQLSTKQFAHVIPNPQSIFPEACIVEYEGTETKEAFESWLERSTKDL